MGLQLYLYARWRCFRYYSTVKQLEMLFLKCLKMQYLWFLPEVLHFFFAALEKMLDFIAILIYYKKKRNDTKERYSRIGSLSFVQ
jgi:hypothetical protein